MSRYPLKGTSKQTALCDAEPGAVEIAAPEPRHGGFVSFRYSYTEVSSQGGRTRVKTKQAQLEDGKLSTEAFEGELDGNVFDEIVQHTRQQVLGQAAWLLRSISSLLAPLRGTRSDHE